MPEPMTYEEYHKRFASKGGKNSQKAQREKYTPEQLTKIRKKAGKKGGLARWGKLSTGE